VATPERGANAGDTLHLGWSKADMHVMEQET
jgi:hypothetical protein